MRNLTTGMLVIIAAAGGGVTATALQPEADAARSDGAVLRSIDTHLKEIQRRAIGIDYGVRGMSDTIDDIDGHTEATAQALRPDLLTSDSVTSLLRQIRDQGR